MANMEITHKGPYPKVTLGGLFVGYGVDDKHPLFDQHAFSFLDDDGVKWHFVYAESVKPKVFSEAEMSAEYLQGLLDFKDACDLDEFYGYMERSPRTNKACEQMHTLSSFLYGIDCVEEGY